MRQIIQAWFVYFIICRLCHSKISLLLFDQPLRRESVNLITLKSDISSSINYQCINTSNTACSFRMGDELPVYLTESLLYEQFAVININIVSGYWDSEQWGGQSVPNIQASLLSVTGDARGRTNQSILDSFRYIRGVLAQSLSLGITAEQAWSMPHLSVNKGNYFAFQSFDLNTHICVDNIRAWRNLIPYNALNSWDAVISRKILSTWLVNSPWRRLSVRIERSSLPREIVNNNRKSYAIDVKFSIDIEGILYHDEIIHNSMLTSIKSLNRTSSLSSNKIHYSSSRERQGLVTMSQIKDSRRDTFLSIVRILNNSPNRHFVRINDLLPDHYDIFISTYQFRIDSHNNSSGWMFACKLPDFSVDLKLLGIGDIKGLVSWSIKLDPEESITIKFSATKKFLHRELYPADSSRGMLTSPTIISIDGCTDCLYSSSATLLTFPFPDFTMPFNVITLSCTVMAFFLGSMINALIKKV